MRAVPRPGRGARRGEPEPAAPLPGSHLRGGGDPTIVNPARLPARALAGLRPVPLAHRGQRGDRARRRQDVRAGRRSRGVAAAAPPAASDRRSSQRHVADDPLYLRNYFWADGTIRVSSRDYSGMIESKCTPSGKLWCGSCHSLHESDPVNLLAARQGRRRRVHDCHPAIAGAPRATRTTRAGSAGSRCYNCHMPHTVYGLLKGIRNHRIDSPHVTGSSGGDERPNACNLCHVDRSLAWTAQQLARWYKQPVAAGLADRRRARRGRVAAVGRRGAARDRGVALRLGAARQGGAGAPGGAVPRRRARRSVRGGALRRRPRARETHRCRRATSCRLSSRDRRDERATRARRALIAGATHRRSPMTRPTPRRGRAAGDRDATALPAGVDRPKRDDDRAGARRWSDRAPAPDSLDPPTIR